jgi:Zn-dependent protease with chaperone function
MTTLGNVRYPSELRTLVLTILISGLIVLFFSPFTMGGVLLVVVLGVVVNAFSIFTSVGRIKRSAAPIERYPEIVQLAEQCRSRLGVTEEIEVYVANGPTVNAYAVGLIKPFAVVIYTGLIEVMDRDELAFVIGHEMGHVKWGHTRILGLIGQLGVQTYGVPVLGYFLRYIFLAWMRVGEYTADRAGLVACGRLDKALSTQLKLSFGPGKARQVDLQSVVAHWRQHDVALADQLGDVLSTHPGLEARLDKLVDFEGSEEYPRLVGRQG